MADEETIAAGNGLEQKTYGKLIYGSNPKGSEWMAEFWGNDTCSYPLISTRYTFQEAEIVQPKPANPPITAMRLPNDSWANYGNYPSDFSRVTLTGSAWQYDEKSYNKEAWVFKPRESGVYKLRVSCGWHLAHKKYGQSLIGVYALDKETIMGMFLMKAGDGELGSLRDEDVGMVGDKYANATLLSTTNGWWGLEIVGTGEPGEEPTTLLPTAEVMVEVGAGEEIIPFISWFALTASGNYSCIALDAIWGSSVEKTTTVIHTGDLNPIYLYSPLMYHWTNTTSPVEDQAYLPVYGEGTSFSYERMLGL